MRFSGDAWPSAASWPSAGEENGSRQASGLTIATCDVWSIILVNACAVRGERACRCGERPSCGGNGELGTGNWELQAGSWVGVLVAGGRSWVLGGGAGGSR